MIVAIDELGMKQPPQALSTPFYIIRYVKKKRIDGRKPWTPENTQYYSQQWYEAFDDLTEAQHINEIEELKGKIYRVEAA